MTRMNELLRDAIMAYCLYMEPDALEELRAAVARDALAWFPAEFELAIAAGTFTPERWGRFTQTGLDDDDYQKVDSDLRLVWSIVAPGRPFPTDREDSPSSPRSQPEGEASP